MFKNIKSFILVVIFVLTFTVFLAGCSSKDKSNATGTDGKDDGVVELTMAVMDTGNIDEVKFVEEEINKITKEKINAKINILPIGPSAWQQQTNLMMTGNEKLDLIVTMGMMNYTTQAVKGQLIPLDDLLASHGQGIIGVVPEHMLDATKVNGISYSVLSFRDWALEYGFVMRKDLVEKYNIDLEKIKTYEDFEPIFKTIKENEPGMYPIANSKGLTVSGRISEHFFDGLGGDKLGVIEMEGDGEVINMYDHPDYKEKINLTRKWFQAGYIMKDAATTDDSEQSIIKAGKAFGYFTHMKPGYEYQSSKLTGHEMVGIRLIEPQQTTSGAISIMMSIPRNSKVPEKAMEFMNLLYTDVEIMNLIANGIEGKHYVLKDGGVIAPPEGVTDSKYTFGAWQVGNNFLTYPWEADGSDLWDRMAEFNNKARLSPAFGFTFDPDSVKTEIASTTNVSDQFRVGLETGTLDPEKSLPEFNKRLMAAGLDKIIAEKQRQLDEWKANR